MTFELAEEIFDYWYDHRSWYNTVDHFGITGLALYYAIEAIYPVVKERLSEAVADEDWVSVILYAGRLKLSKITLEANKEKYGC